MSGIVILLASINSILLIDTRYVIHSFSTSVINCYMFNQKVEKDHGFI